MGYSKLTDKFIPAYSGNYTVGRNQSIKKITIHHVAGVVSIEQLGNIWQRPGRNGSSNYGIGNDGRIACYVDENNTSWCDSNWTSNNQSITIETSNNKTGGDWTVEDRALNSLIKLIADICKRYKIKPVKGKTITWHRMYVATTCPGEYLLSKMDYIIDEVKKILNDKPEPTTKFKIGDKVIVNGKLYSNSYAENYAGNVDNRVTFITRFNPGSKHPYNTTGDLGWMDEKDIKKYEDKPNEFKVGDIVEPIELVDYRGVKLYRYDNRYEITRIDNRGAVLCAVRGNNRPIWAVLSLNNIRRIK